MHRHLICIWRLALAIVLYAACVEAAPKTVKVFILAGQSNMVGHGRLEDGSSWGELPSPKTAIGDSTATFEYNVYVYCFTPAYLRGILFLTGKSMVVDHQGANFGSELSVLANSFKAKFDSGDVQFIYTVPGKELAPLSGFRT